MPGKENRATGHPSISVILPTFNRAWTVAGAVASVLDQTWTDFELIVVDDGSTDDTAAVLAPYADRLRLLHQSNGGVSAARNAGIDAARGRLIAFLDSDDRWMPKKLAVQKAFFDAHPEAKICQTEEVWIRNGVRVNPGKRHRKPSGDIFIPSLALCLVSPSAVMMRRELFDDVGRFDETLPACEDYDLWLRVACRYPVYRITTPLIVKHGGHADQLSKMSGLDQYRIESLKKVLASGPLDAGQRQAAAATLVEKCRIFAAGCRKRGRDADADHYLALARKYSDR